MAYLVKDELSSVIRLYQLDSITDSNDDLVNEAIEAAIDQVSNILTPDNNKVWKDGRLAYDTQAIFAATGTDRNILMLGYVKTVTIWHLIGLCNTGMVYQQAQDRYDRTISMLNDLADGTSNSATLPKVIADPPKDDLPYQFGSRTKFQSE